MSPPEKPQPSMNPLSETIDLNPGVPCILEVY